MLARALIVILEAALDNVLQDELESLRELDERADALMG